MILSDPAPCRRVEGIWVLGRTIFTSYRPRGPSESEQRPARPPLSGCPDQAVPRLAAPFVPRGQSPRQPRCEARPSQPPVWPPHLAAQQRLAVVVCAVLALPVVQLLGFPRRWLPRRTAAAAPAWRASGPAASRQPAADTQ